MKQCVLNYTPNIESLGAIVHASPGMHQLYAADRKRYFTRVTINELRNKGIDLTPTPVAEVHSSTKDSLEKIRKAKPELVHSLKSLYAYLSQEKYSLRLEFHECKVLRQIEGLIRWDLTLLKTSSGKKVPGSVTAACGSDIWPLNRGCYFNIYLGDDIDTSDQLDWVIWQCIYRERFFG